MNTVDAIKRLGTAVLGDAYDPPLNGNNADTIKHLADSIEEAGGITPGGGGGTAYTFDDVPIEGSDNPVKSGGIYAAIEDVSEQSLAAPETPGLNGQVLTSDGNGGQTWTTPSGGGGEGGSVTVDTTLDTTSANPVQNATIAAAINAMDTVIKSEIYDNSTRSIAISDITFTDGKTISLNSGSEGNLTNSSVYSTSDPIDLTGATSIKICYTGTNPSGRYCFYTANNAYISHAAIPARSSATNVAVPENAAYVRFCGMTSRLNNIEVTISSETPGNIYTALGSKLDSNQGAANAGKVMGVDSLGNVVPQEAASPSASGGSAKPVYMKSHPVKPLLPEIMAGYAWCSMHIPSEWTKADITMTISGTAGESTVTVSNFSAVQCDTDAAMADVTLAQAWTDKWIGGVISSDGVHFKTCNFKLTAEGASTLTVYPPLTENITNGVLSNMLTDSNETSVGLHLSTNGYKGYCQHIFAQNPKHCEVGRYVARFTENDTDVSDSSVFPWVQIGTGVQSNQYRWVNENMNKYWLQKTTSNACMYIMYASYTPWESKTGAYWEVDLKGNTGYLEAYVFPVASTIELPEGQEIHVVVTIDGVEELHETLTDSICKRIICDYENATTGKIEIYSNKWSPVNGAKYGFGIGRVTWWVNDLDYSDNKLFPRGAVIGQEFDSWGTVRNAATEVEFKRLQNENTGVTVDYTNHSRGSQTSAWGAAYFYANIIQYHPSICIHDFVINDANSLGSALVPETVSGPDGTSYNNKLTSAQYAANMNLIADMAISNGIQPILMRNMQHSASAYATFTRRLIDSMSSKVS